MGHTTRIQSGTEMQCPKKKTRTSDRSPRFVYQGARLDDDEYWLLRWHEPEVMGMGPNIIRVALSECSFPVRGTVDGV